MFEELLISVLFIIVLIILCVISNLYSKKGKRKSSGPSPFIPNPTKAGGTVAVKIFNNVSLRASKKAQKESVTHKS